MAMRESLNASACAALLEDVTWSEPSLLAQLSVLAAINVMVIVGNCLVIAAVFCSSKLRSVTNLFIVSLAVADLLVGVAVLPFSATWEIFKVIDKAFRGSSYLIGTQAMKSEVTDI